MGILLEGAFDIGNRLLAGTPLVQKDAQEVQRLRVVRLLAKDVPVNRFRAFELAALMQAKPVVQPLIRETAAAGGAPLSLGRAGLFSALLAVHRFLEL